MLVREASKRYQLPSPFNRCLCFLLDGPQIPLFSSENFSAASRAKGTHSGETWTRPVNLGVRRCTNPPVSLQPPGVIFLEKGSVLRLFLTQTPKQRGLCFSIKTNHTSHPGQQQGAASSVAVGHCPTSSLSISICKMGRKLLRFPWLQPFLPVFDQGSPGNTPNPARRVRICLCSVKNKTEEQSGGDRGEPHGCPGEVVIGDDAELLPLHLQPGIWGKFE